MSRYEELRKVALEGLGATSVGLGAAVLVRRGMAAWMHALADCCHLDTEPVEPRLVQQDLICPEVAPEVVLVLAEMSLQANMEER